MEIIVSFKLHGMKIREVEESILKWGKIIAWQSSLLTHVGSVYT